MANVTLMETPTQQIVSKAHAEANVSDALGRTITLKKPSLVEQYRIIRVLGEDAKNEVYLNMVMPLFYVAAINGEAAFQPANQREIDALLKRLDEAGLEAVVDGIKAHFRNAQTTEVAGAEIKK